VLRFLEPISKRDVALPIQHAFHCKPDGLGRPDENSKLLGLGQSGVQKIPLLASHRTRSSRFLLGHQSQQSVRQKDRLSKILQEGTLRQGVQAEPSFMDFCWVWEQDVP
jgi:hypothetical protein